MTDVDWEHDAERRLREDLRRTLVPPPTPESLYVAVGRLADRPPVAEPARPWTLRTKRGRRGFEAAARIAAVVTLAVGLWAFLHVRDQGEVATSPHPTLPAVVESPLPPAAVHPTLLESGAWVDPHTAWTVDRVPTGDLQRHLRISEDGGQTWSEPRPMDGDDVGFAMFDADRGYLGSAFRAAGTFQPLLYRTSDGGRTWGEPIFVGSLKDSSANPYVFAANVHFVDPAHGVFLATSREQAARGAQGTALECLAFATDDGGTTWNGSPGPCLGVGGVSWFSPTVGAIVAEPPAPTLSITQDGGRTWTTAPAPSIEGATTFAPMVVARSADGALRMLGAIWTGSGPEPPAVFESRDDGRSWVSGYPAAGLPAINPGLAWALDGDHWLAASELDSQGGMQLHESWDAGRTWSVASEAAILPGSMRWLDRLHGTLQGVPIVCSGTSCGGDGTILLTNDGGQTWHEVPF